MLYQSFVPLQELWNTAHRIFDPLSYKETVSERFIPVCLEEAFKLCAYYPIVWCRNEVGDLELIAVRQLRSEVSTLNPDQIRTNCLPLALQAFPFRYKNLSGGDLELGLERTTPMSERNIGTYIYDHLGNFQTGAELKIRSLERFKSNYTCQKILTNNLLRHSMLEPVNMPEQLCKKCQLPDFFAAIEHPDPQLSLQSIPKSDQKMVLTFLTAQRLSLFKMATIIGQSKIFQQK
ncbi:SapC family protein [Donghicola mangrovi]|uniref:SapC family protein n=1 Tax=Donghicola mangrovi TaxID=2729614 RepID=A0A850Q512_9RHOB|nr:SapC family protein [Donghicola mangrovi]NVO21730.1 SapC family protein [Donghicola mangrovi]